MAILTISLPDSLKSFVQKQIKTRGFGNVSEYFRDLLRQAQAHEQEANLDMLLRDGLSSGKGTEATEEFWRELKNEIAQRLAHKRTKK
jgi:antitoxin ParD1/3/4